MPVVFRFEPAERVRGRSVVPYTECGHLLFRQWEPEECLMQNESWYFYLERGQALVLPNASQRMSNLVRMSSEITFVSFKVGMKFVSPFQRGTMWK